MQDIDFDEIDRAVSSVSNKSTGATRATPFSAPSQEVATPVVVNITNKSEEPQVDTSSSIPVSSFTTPSPAARRSAGRFMDVVHPSSDMRPVSPVSREVNNRPEEKPETPESSETSAFHWPDPIDVAQSDAASEEPVAETIEPTITQVPKQLVDDTPLESPFLTDAKVEKRPLGAFSSNNAEPELALIEDFPEPKMSESIEALEAEEVEVPELPAEEMAEEAPIEIAEPTPVAEVVPVGPTSITQQYKEAPSSTAQSTGSIYDTEAYHQPVTHVPKRNSAVMITVWIAGLIIVGGGIGAAIYFVFLPMLG